MKLDGEGRPLAVVRRARNVATQLIEEFMIAANEAVADYLLWAGVPFMSRIHEDPFPDDVAALRERLAPLGYHVPATRAPRPADLQTILEASRNRPEKDVVHAALLRALPQARYSEVRAPHYALASSNYTHFTSPIRRYPDLTVHRQVAAVLAGTADREPAALGNLTAQLGALADSCSRAERTADKAEAESLRLKKTELAKRFLGDVGEGAVVDVFDFGAFVRLPNGVEGLVPTSALGGHTLRLGEQITVQIVRADLEKRQVDMSPAD
jgi:ribonuclease R